MSIGINTKTSTIYLSWNRWLLAIYSMIDGVKSGQPKNQNKLVVKFLMTSKFILKKLDNLLLISLCDI